MYLEAKFEKVKKNLKINKLGKFYWLKFVVLFDALAKLHYSAR